MRTLQDQLVKNILRGALSLIGQADLEVEFPGAVQKIDVFCVPDPASTALREQMGLLGAIADGPSLFEPYSSTPGLPHARDCLRKQLGWDHESRRRTREEQRRQTASSGPEPFVDEAADVASNRFPSLIMVSPGRPETVLAGYSFASVAPGVYRSTPALQFTTVVVAELPRSRDTLFLRLLGSHNVFHEALDELKRLPENAWEVLVARPWLVHFAIELPGAPPPAEDIVMDIQAWYREFQEKQARAEAERLAQALQEAEARAEARAREAEARAVEQGHLEVLRGVFARKLARPLSPAEMDALHQRLQTLGSERLTDAVFGLEPAELATWLADPAAA